MSQICNLITTGDKIESWTQEDRDNLAKALNEIFNMPIDNESIMVHHISSIHLGEKDV